MEEIFQIVIVVIEAFLAVVVSYVGWKFQKMKDLEEKREELRKASEIERQRRDNLLEKATMFNLRMNILRECNHYQEKGFAPIYAAGMVEEMFAVYHELGGNGGIDTAINDFRKLPHSPAKGE